MSLKFKVRGPEPGDLNFILSTWLKGFYFGNEWLKKHVEAKAYFEFFEEIAKAVLTRADTEVRVSCLEEDENVILGYSIIEGTCLHFVFVKEPWRKLGIAKALTLGPLDACSCVTDLGHKLKPHNWKLNPFLLTGGVNGRKESRNNDNKRSW